MRFSLVRSTVEECMARACQETFVPADSAVSRGGMRGGEGAMFPAALRLSSEQTRQAIRLAGKAPSLHNRQPWRFRVSADEIDLCADAERRLPATDPQDTELRLGCGAALLNLRVVLEHYGISPSVSLLPQSPHSEVLATIRHGGAMNPAAERPALLSAISARRTNRRPFLPTPVPSVHAAALREAVRNEHSWLHVVGRQERAAMLKLVRRAHDVEMNDPDFRAELQHWTGRREGEREGVPASAAGPMPEEQDEWVLRDFSGGQAPPRVAGKDFEDDPLIVVLCSHADGPVGELQAGQAMQRALLTMTSLGLSASFLAQVIETRETWSRLRELVGGRVYPRVVMRVGYGSPVPATPRRAPEELLLNDDLADLELGL